MARTPEGKVKEGIKRFLHGKGCLRAGSEKKHWPNDPVGWYYMPIQTAFGVHGIPDFVGHYYGKFFSIEAKAEGRLDDLSANQEMRRDELNQTGGVVFVVDDVRQLEIAWQEQMG